ncbi:DUF4422 domain-containing protein [Paenibacillus hunanensis]|uniref:DUF4422 domain-containing protein n=1 Tax=Paenibacillus hunanensis TaxID=539262 RepID=UPI002026892F|nr:DUF4422 domain-containing protein [Paenibacillus hunanensis]MCL9662781.1 DUF4422 domain-containing protein [Paenibacillus hunanensis]
MSGKIAVCYHKTMPVVQNEVLTPILLNARNNSIPGFLYTDDMGDNISDKNPTYCELTALYTIWKNDIWVDTDYIGLFHYRRILSLNEKLNNRLPDYDLFEINELNDEYSKYGLTKQQIDQCMMSFDVLLPKLKLFPTNIYTQYAESKDHHSEHIDYALEYISQHNEDYIQSAQAILTGNEISLYNMFVMHVSLFRQYCEWLFPLLQYVESKVDTTTFNTQELRYIGFLTERLFNVFIHHQKTLKSLRIGYFPVLQSNYESTNADLQQLLKTTNEVVVFGTGVYATKMISMMSNQIICFMDNNSDLQSFADKQVYTPAEYQSRYQKSYPILICSSYDQEISQQLSSMGYEQNKDYFKLDTSYFIEQAATSL